MDRRASISDERVFRRIAIYLGETDPTGNLELEYITEGAANVVWSVRIRNSNIAQHDGKLALRMRKDLPSTAPMKKLRDEYETRVAPLFLFDPSLLLPVQLIETSSATIKRLNDTLHCLEADSTRPAFRQNVYLPSFDEESYAQILPNLFYGEGKELEFKPKWLVQSPSAPRSAERCRTCALNAMRRHRGIHTGRGDSGFCPFDLLSSHPTILSQALSQIWTDKRTLSSFVAAFQKRLQPALRQLQQLQHEHNTVGLKDFRDPEGKDFSLAMAIRDCSVFVKIVNSDDSDSLSIETIKLLDLDLKDTAGGKLKKWAQMEDDMIQGGWYTAEKTPEVQCAMSYQ